MPLQAVCSIMTRTILGFQLSHFVKGNERSNIVQRLLTEFLPSSWPSDFKRMTAMKRCAQQIKRRTYGQVKSGDWVLESICPGYAQVSGLIFFLTAGSSMISAKPLTESVGKCSNSLAGPEHKRSLRQCWRDCFMSWGKSGIPGIGKMPIHGQRIFFPPQSYRCSQCS